MSGKQPCPQQHAFVRVAGFNLVILPWDLFTGKVVNDCHLDIELKSGKFARIIPDNGGYQSKVDSSTTKSLHEVVEIGALATPLKWEIQTSLFACDWPAGLTLITSAFPENPALFDLCSGNGLMISVQTPRNIPSLSGMCAAHQTIVHMEPGAAHPFVLLSYCHAGEDWMQRHSIATVGMQKVILSAQCPAALWSESIHTVEQFEASIQETEW